MTTQDKASRVDEIRTATRVRKLTSTQMRYLTALYVIIRNGGMADDELVATSLLSDMMQEPNSNTSRMIERLREQDMIQHVPYQGVRLTLEGEAK
ncbi:MAG: hypothetical protein AAFQ52_14370, partial [Chloroflexota bacterium]